VIVAALTVSRSAAQNRGDIFSAEDYRDVAGILSWMIEVPADLAEGQFLSTSWLFPSLDGKRSEVRASGLDFRDVPRGETVKVFVWTQTLVKANGNGEGGKGMKFCLKFRGENHKIQKRFGTLEIPEGYVDIYGHLAASDRPYDDGGWLMMMTNPNGNRGADSCTLNLDYENR